MKQGVVCVCLLIVLVLFAGCGSTETVSDKIDTKVTDLNEEMKEEVIEETIEEVTNTSAEKVYRLSELQEDFNQLKTNIESVHPKLYADLEELNLLFETNYGLIEENMTELEFLRLLTPIVSKLNCGHTSVYLSASHYSDVSNNRKLFPLPIKFIKNQTYITKDKGTNSIPAGSEVLSINGKTVNEIKDKLFANLPADGHNETLKYQVVNNWFSSLYYELVDASSNYKITYKTKQNSDVLSANLSGITDSEFGLLYETTVVEREEPYSSEFRENYALLDMNSFYPQGKYTISKYKTFIDDFFKEVKDKNITNVILDVRDNGGGDPYVTSHLFNYLAEKSQPYFAESAIDYYAGLKDPVPLAENNYNDNLYILMNGGSFSSTGHLLALLKYQDIGVFIGEESGASFACTDASKNYILQNTKIQYRSSTMLWEVAVEGLVAGRGIMPDYEVEQTIETFIQNRDVIKEFVIGLTQEK